MMLEYLCLYIECNALAFTIPPDKVSDPDNNSQLQPYFEVTESNIIATKLPQEIHYL